MTESNKPKKKYSIEQRVSALEQALSYYAQRLESVQKKCKCQWHPAQCDGKLKTFFKKLFRAYKHD